MHEGNAALQRGDLRNQRQIVNFLPELLAQHGPARGAAGHHVGVVAKIDSACVASVRAVTCMVAGVSFTGNLDMLESSAAGPATR